MAGGYENRDEARAVQNRMEAPQQTNQLGPGTAGLTISGAAYRGMETAADTGKPSPADQGFPVTRVGLYPGQGVEGDTTITQTDGDLSGQDFNISARLGRNRTAVDVLTRQVGGEPPKNR